MDRDQATADGSTEHRFLRRWRGRDNAGGGQHDGNGSELEGSTAANIPNLGFHPATFKPKASFHDVSAPEGSPGQPVYGVSMSAEAIADIVRIGWPGATAHSITPLEAGKSFNNKIYFVTLRHRSPGGDQEAEKEAQEAVLKVNGTIYDGDKVQNEVACLRLLEMYCPDVPAPRVLAWSEAGVSATFVSPTHHDAETKALERDIDGEGQRRAGWILTSRLPGKPVASPEELDDAALAGLATQLAGLVARWRRCIPAQAYCGNLQIRKAAILPSGGGIALDRPCGPGIPGLAIRGILVEELKLTAPIARMHDYYGLKLDNKLRLLASSDTLARNRHLLGPLRTFRSEHLPKLRFTDMFAQSATPTEDTDTDTDTFLFTHYDLFPRNILVEGSPPRVTGIVDWEFSGFFPPVDEFLDDWLDGDWPEPFYTAFLQSLEESGVATPAGSVRGESSWQLAYWLERTIESAAPWWLPGNLNADQVDKALETAESVVGQMLRNLGCVCDVAT